MHVLRYSGPAKTCVSQASHEKNDTKGWFLYINTFELEPDYRKSTWVGAMALRSLLTYGEHATSWSLAVYIPFGTTQFSQEEATKHDIVQRKRRQAKIAYAFDESFVRTPAEVQEEEEWMLHFGELTKQDMRQFFRAGFQQAKETVFDSDSFHVFCVPSFLENPIMSHEEALSIQITEKKSPVKEPTGISKELLKFMVSSCSKRRRLTTSLRASEQPLREQNEFREMFEALDQKRSRAQQVIQDCDESEERMRHVIEERDTALALIAEISEETEQCTQEPWKSINSLLAEVQPKVELMREMRNLAEESLSTLQELEEEIQRVARAAKEKVEKEIRELDSLVRTNVRRLVTDEEGGIIIQSTALHACACNLVPTYAEMLLELVPDSRKVQAINCFDRDGATPLMTAASSLHFTDPEDRYRMCETLIHLTADKNVTDEAGRTALGHFRQSEQRMRDFDNTFGLSLRGPSEIEMSRRMETLLMPLLGPTSADAAGVDDALSSEEDEDEMSDNSFHDEDESIGDDDEDDVAD